MEDTQNDTKESSSEQQEPSKGELKRIGRFLVWTGEFNGDINELIELAREERMKQVGGF